MSADWQSWAAASVVIATMGVFVCRVFGKRKHGSCNSCGTGGQTVKRR